MRLERLGQYIDERGRMACHYHFVPDIAPAVAALDAIDPTGDPEHGHILADKVLLDALGPEVEAPTSDSHAVPRVHSCANPAAWLLPTQRRQGQPRWHGRDDHQVRLIDPPQH